MELGLIHNKDHLTAAGVVGRGKQHAVALNAGETRGRKVGDDNDFPADQLFRSVIVLDAGNDDAFPDAVKERELEAVGGLADLLRLENFTDAQIDSGKCVDVDFFFDIRDRVRFAVDLLGNRFFLDRRLVQFFFFLGPGIGEIQQSDVAFRFDGVEEEIQARPLFLVDQQLIDILEEGALQLFEFLIGDGSDVKTCFGMS